MTPASATDLVREALYTTLWLCLPLLLTGFIASIVISLVQTLTAIQDSAFSTVPRLAVFLAAFVLAMPWMLSKWIGYATALFGDLARYAR